MKKFVLILFLVLMSGNAYGAEPTILEVDKFDEFVVSVLKEDKMYTGILLDADEHLRFLSLDKEVPILEAKLKVYEDSSSKVDNLFGKIDDFHSDMSNDLKKLKKIASTRSFWDEHKFEIGIVLGAALAVSVAALVN